MLRVEAVLAEARACESAVSVISAPAAAQRGVAAAPLRITVTNGDLRFESEHLLLVTMERPVSTGAGTGINSRWVARWSTRWRWGSLRIAQAEHQIFINTRSNPQEGVLVPRPPAVIVVRLGDEDFALRAGEITRSVSQAVMAWAQRMAEHNRQGTGVGLTGDADRAAAAPTSSRRSRPPRGRGRVRSKYTPQE